MTTTITVDQYYKDFSELSPMMKTLVRRTASLELQERGFEEIGSSDVSCTVYDLYKSLGTFEAIIKYGLELINNN